MGTNSGFAWLQELVANDAKQVAKSLFESAPDERPLLNDELNWIDTAESTADRRLDPIQGLQMSILGHSVGGGLTIARRISRMLGS